MISGSTREDYTKLHTVTSGKTYRAQANDYYGVRVGVVRLRSRVEGEVTFWRRSLARLELHLHVQLMTNCRRYPAPWRYVHSCDVHAMFAMPPLHVDAAVTRGAQPRFCCITSFTAPQSDEPWQHGVVPTAQAHRS